MKVLLIKPNRVRSWKWVGRQSGPREAPGETEIPSQTYVMVMARTACR